MTSAPSSFHMDGDDLIIVIVGVLDGMTAGEAATTAGQAFRAEGGAKRLVVDVSETSFVDSSGLAALVHMRNDAKDRGLPMLLRGPTQQLRRVLEIAGLASVFGVTDET